MDKIGLGDSEGIYGDIEDNYIRSSRGLYICIYIHVYIYIYDSKGVI